MRKQVRLFSVGVSFFILFFPLRALAPHDSDILVLIRRINTGRASSAPEREQAVRQLVQIARSTTISQNEFRQMLTVLRGNRPSVRKRMIEAISGISRYQAIPEFLVNALIDAITTRPPRPEQRASKLRENRFEPPGENPMQELDLHVQQAAISALVTMARRRAQAIPPRFFETLTQLLSGDSLRMRHFVLGALERIGETRILPDAAVEAIVDNLSNSETNPQRQAVQRDVQHRAAAALAHVSRLSFIPSRALGVFAENILSDSRFSYALDEPEVENWVFLNYDGLTDHQREQLASRYNREGNTDIFQRHGLHVLPGQVTVGSLTDLAERMNTQRRLCRRFNREQALAEERATTAQ